MGKEKSDEKETKKAFRITPGQAQDAMKIIVGNKTNATIRDLEEEEGELEEKTGTVISITRNKINGDGWVIKDEEGNIYNCSCASNMYEIPAATERGGVLYPNDTVTVKFTVNPVLRLNTITEITSLGEEDTTLDVSEWRHDEEATTVIAKPKSAISVSNAKITFNYNNTNTVTADDDAVTMDGEATKIKSKKLDIDSDDITVQKMPLTDYIMDYSLFNLMDYETQTSTMGDENAFGIDMFQQGGMGQININRNIFLNGNEMILADLKNPKMFPSKRQKYPLLSDGIIDEINIYPNGLITAKATGDMPGNRNILSTINWITPQYEPKNLITVAIGKICDCCQSDSGVASYFNYCPHCQTWRTLYEVNNQIKCTTCGTVYCEACGHDVNENCAIKTYDLKKYDDNKISGEATYCTYCKDQIPAGEEKEYANWCPYCHQWGYLHIKEETVNGESKKTLECTYCGKGFCLNCATLQGQRTVLRSFLSTISDNVAKPLISYEEFEKNTAPYYLHKMEFTRVI